MVYAAVDAGTQRGITISLFLVFVIITLGITFWASRQTRNATDFYAGGRSFSGFQNGMAIGGDYMSAASFLGIWWRGLTDLGAAAGILAGGGGAVAAVLVTFLSPTRHGLTATLLSYPAAWTVPLAFAVMVGVSLATRRRVPGTVGLAMLRLHAPDALRL